MRCTRKLGRAERPPLADHTTAALKFQGHKAQPQACDVRAALPHGKLTCISMHGTMNSTRRQIVVLLCRIAVISLLAERMKGVTQLHRMMLHAHFQLAESCITSFTVGDGQRDAPCRAWCTRA